MFRQRTSSQKPGDDFVANFRQQFPEIASGSSGAASASHTVTAGNQGDAASASDRNAGVSHDAFHDQDPTPRATNEPWRFTPSLMDPNSFSFSTFANAPPGYYTPTPGGTNTIYHPQAGDLHTPTLGFGMGLGTPLSMPTTDAGLQTGPGMMDMSAFHHAASGMHPSQFHHQAHFNPFVQPQVQQQAFAPSTFVHQDTGYETMDQDGSPMDSDPSEDARLGSIDSAFQAPSPMVGYQDRQYGMAMQIPMHPSAEKFRFHVTLNAPTAMIKHADEIPVTYLNKGQAYSLSILDTTPTIPIAPGTRFRTFVRVSFEDDQQRQKPGVCWSLWKEGRGTNEAHQRGGKLQAVEYVEAGQPAEGDDKRTRVQLESASFDGFSVIWTPGVNGVVECNVAVRFNFLSTDFSHSKGVKGIPVRLCAKTNLLTADGAPSGDEAPEICYCKVKLFRDHGAERKLSNDVAHVKKTIDKLKQQIAQAESGLKDFGKRKRAAGTQLKGSVDNQRPGKTQKHKRTWSMSSASSAGGGSGGGGARNALEEDLHFKLQTLQDMFTSTRPTSVLYLRGEDLDDPDTHPVSLPGESLDLTKIESRDSNVWRDRSTHSSVTGSLVSPSPSSLSLHSAASVGGPNAPWQDRPAIGSDPSSRQGSDQPTRVAKSDIAHSLSGWIEALGVDPSYRPPPERAVKPVACFYLRQKSPEPETRQYHKAIYVMQRTLSEFVARIASKWNIDVNRVSRVIRTLPNGLEVELDDDVIRELTEGQDMTLEIVEQSAPKQPVKREWEMSLDDAPGEEEDSVAGQTLQQSSYEFRLAF